VAAAAVVKGLTGATKRSPEPPRDTKALGVNDWGKEEEAAAAGDDARPLSPSEGLAGAW
jgi:hypothetical protein